MPLHLFFFYATVILLPTQLGLHFWPDWALVIGRRLDYLSPTLFLTDITILLTLISWFLSSFSSLKIKNNLKFLAFAGFIGLNIFFTTSPLITIYKWLKVLEFIMFGFYIVKTRPSFSRSLWCLSFAVFYSSIIAITQFFLQHSVGGLLWFLGERTFDITTPGIARIQTLPFLPSYCLPVLRSMELLRPYATFPHPNVLGGFLAATIPLVVINNLTLKKLNNLQISLLKIFRVITIILSSLAFILTFSRSAWVAGTVGLLIVLFLHFKSKRNYPFVVCMVFVVFVGFFLVFPYFQSLTPNSESVFVRKELNSAAISIWKTSPFLGVGLGNYLIKLPTYYPHRDIFFLQPVHNIYLLILSETGILGLFFFGWLIVYIVRNYELRMRNKGKNNQQFSSIILYSLFLILLLGFVDHYPLTLQQGQLLLTILISFSFL